MSERELLDLARLLRAYIAGPETRPEDAAAARQVLFDVRDLIRDTEETE